MSLIKIRKSSGPEIDPWVLPLSTNNRLDTFLFKERAAAYHLTNFPTKLTYFLLFHVL